VKILQVKKIQIIQIMLNNFMKEARTCLKKK
jgi:hypothetical protein